MTIEQLQAQNAQLQAMVAQLTETVQHLTGQLEWCRRQLYGRKSERYEDPNQPKLFDDPAGESPQPPAPTVTVPAHSRRSQNRGKREPIPDHLRREPVIHDLPADQKTDPVTGAPRVQKIGEEVTEKLAFKPGEVYVEQHVRIKYRRLDENLDGSEPEVITASPGPSGPSRCLAAPSLLAQVVLSKYGDHLPLDRLVRMFKREGVDLAKSTMCRWTQQVGELAEPLLSLMKRRMLEHSTLLQHDDTPVRQQPSPGGRGRRCKTCHFWPTVGQPGTDGYYVLFHYTQDRTRAGPEGWFRDDQGRALFTGGELQCDGYAGYHGLFDPDGPWKMTHIGCWAHVRRKFHDARMSSPGQASWALGLIGRLYDLERQAKDTPSPDRQSKRQQHATPLVHEFFDWCRSQQRDALPKSDLGKALTYALNQETSLRRYLEAGHRPIDNNACERSLRGIAIGRKNWLFTGSEAGGTAAARLFSLIGSATLHQLNPRDYLHDLITHLPTTSPDDLHRFLPDRWATDRR